MIKLVTDKNGNISAIKLLLIVLAPLAIDWTFGISKNGMWGLIISGILVMLPLVISWFDRY